MTKQEHDKMVVDAVHDNHMWINAFFLINPTDELKMSIGEFVIDGLKNRDALLPSFYGESQAAQELAELSPQFYCRFNAS